MCGRAALALEPDILLGATGAVAWHRRDSYRKSYNIGPARNNPVLLSTRAKTGGNRRSVITHPIQDHLSQLATTHPNGTVLFTMTWGFVPFWTKETPNYNNYLNTINARDDSLLENKPLWNRAKQSQRCVVVVQGFFEWLKKGKERLAYYFHPPDPSSLLFLAGLWDSCSLPSSTDTLFSYSIVTVSASKIVSFLHDRMPAILHSKVDVDRWLDPDVPFDSVKHLLRPTEDNLVATRVGSFVNKIGNDSELCVTPFQEGGKGSLMAFFGKKVELKEEEKNLVGDGNRTSGVIAEYVGEHFVKEETNGEKAENAKGEKKSVGYGNETSSVITVECVGEHSVKGEPDGEKVKRADKGSVDLGTSGSAETQATLCAVSGDSKQITHEQKTGRTNDPHDPEASYDTPGNYVVFEDTADHVSETDPEDDDAVVDTWAATLIHPDNDAYLASRLQKELDSQSPLNKETTVHPSQISQPKVEEEDPDVVLARQLQAQFDAERVQKRGADDLASGANPKKLRMTPKKGGGGGTGKGKAASKPQQSITAFFAKKDK